MTITAIATIPMEDPVLTEVWRFVRGDAQIAVFEQWIYEICRLCNWEDDGQDDPHADEVWGGPNGAYSFAKARINFRQHLAMYDPLLPDSRIGGRDSSAQTEAKRSIIVAFEGMRAARDESFIDALWATIRAGEAVLVAELRRKVREYEAQDA